MWSPSHRAGSSQPVGGTRQETLPQGGLSGPLDSSMRLQRGLSSSHFNLWACTPLSVKWEQRPFLTSQIGWRISKIVCPGMCHPQSVGGVWGRPEAAAGQATWDWGLLLLQLPLHPVPTPWAGGPSEDKSLGFSEGANLYFHEKFPEFYLGAVIQKHLITFWVCQTIPSSHGCLSQCQQTPQSGDHRVATGPHLSQA